MFVSDKLKISESPSKIFLEFDVKRKSESQYITENFELYAQNEQNEKYLFDHIYGLRSAQHQEGNIIFMNSQSNPIYIIGNLEKCAHLWEQINNKQRPLFYALQKTENKN